ncbi:MAG: phospholipase C, phosphocholine-specific [Gammaproteobacteria bacterium]|nr:MAG: phospholipase C, phosphocholine-specific [Gammaproteobacteria bacterium]
MTTLDRRNFLRLAGAGALAAALPNSIRRALAIPAHNATGTINDVEHIVILMQENRSFDHYFGALRGVRGFSDPRAVLQRDGAPIWRQRVAQGSGNYVLPFRPTANDLGMQFLEDLPHDWNSSHAACNLGANDQWVPAKGATTMAYLTREDVPFHYALADAFTICDAYHCSLLGPTDPNRYYMWTGYVGNDGAGGGPVIDNAEAGYGWSTYPERLQRAGVGWKVYQDIGDGLDAGGYWGWTGDAYIGNYGDNSLLYFHQYQNAQPGNALYEGARRGTNIKTGGGLFDQFAADVANGTLPQVSWIVAPEAYTEHPNWPANYGAWYVAQILDALTANPDVWSKTVLLLTFDENDGFFDHVPPPFAPPSPAQGASTVATTHEYFAGNAAYRAGPYGLGARVPMLVISPWSRGGYVNSQLFDHTSIIRFIEQRFAATNPDLIEANISPWRRAVCGDLTSAFDFAHPNAAWPHLPATDAFAPRDAQRHPDYQPQPPHTPQMPRQEGGVRPARALPYALEASALIDAFGNLSLQFDNSGAAAAVFHLRARDRADGPWMYTVEAGKSLGATFMLAATQGAYDFAVHGPNGFYRRFVGHARGAGLGVPDPDARIAVDAANNLVTLRLNNPSNAPIKLRVVDVYGGSDTAYTLAPAQSIARHFDLGASFNWYDLSVSDDSGNGFRRHFAGHVENGKDGVSDPLIGAAIG